MHSNKIKIHLVFTVTEVAIFIMGLVSVYLSENSQWTEFLFLAILSVVLYMIVKFFQAYPVAKDLLVQEDMASKIAGSAVAYGVERYFNMQDPKEQAIRNTITQDDIREANSLWLCANSGASYIDPAVYRHWSTVESRLKEGVEFRIVLLDPYSKEKKFRNKINVGGEQLDSKLNLANLIKLYNQYQNLEIRFVKNGMHATVFATNQCLYFDPYQVGVVGERIENRSFSLRIVQTQPSEGVGLYRLYKAHFDTLWRSSTEFSDWLKAVSKKLPEGLPDVKER